MIKIVKFDNLTTYMFPNGEIATPEVIRAKFPAVEHFTHILEINGDICQAVQSLKTLRNIYNISDTLSEDDAINAIETIINTPQEVSPMPDERLAAAAEFQNILSLPDIIGVATETDDRITKQNYGRGLWNKEMLKILIKKGCLTELQYETIIAKHS